MISLLFTAASAMAMPDATWLNLTVYRVTPINAWSSRCADQGCFKYTGVTNMDTGDAAGDTYFGLSQLLLPQLCAVEPAFLWCENRKFLSGGSAHMVYSEFVVSTRPIFGDYMPCNPNPKTGEFACGEFKPDGPARKPLPQTCETGYDVWHADCLNGTKIKAMPNHTSGECCAACTADKECQGWNMPGPHGSDGNDCQLMGSPLVMFNGGQGSTGCAAGVKDPDGRSSCWYKDPDYNTTFDPYCSRSNCTCAAIEKLAMGREEHPMCHHHGSSGKSPHSHYFTSKWGYYIEDLACKTLGNWYSTQEGGQCKEGESHADCWWELKETKRTINATCADTRVIEAVQAKRPECWKECPVKEAENRTSACFLTCLFDTILGNATTGLKGMTRDEIVKPFEKAFSSAVPAEGGCGSVKPEPPAPPHPHPPSPPSYKCDGVGVATRASCTKPGIERPDATTCIAAGCCYDPENSPNCWKPKEV